MYHRRLFTTTVGYFGIGTRTLVPGDQIAVILGCRLPLILTQTEKSGHYKLVGECYIHGYMNGGRRNTSWKVGVVEDKLVLTLDTSARTMSARTGLRVTVRVVVVLPF
jgi:hypothetical protein